MLALPADDPVVVQRAVADGEAEIDLFLVNSSPKL
jgi:hypothetical protein